MQPKELHDFLFKLYDFADEATTNPEVMPPADYKMGFIIAAYIEDFMNIYGRSLIYKTAKDAGINAEESLKSAHERIDHLRAELSAIDDNPELRSTIDEAVRRLKKNYGTR